MPKKEHAVPADSGVAHISTIPIKKYGTFNWQPTPAKESKEDKWEDLPNGWTSASRDKFAKSIGGESKAKEGPVDTCMNKIDGHVSDPGAFCASLHDRVTGTTDWRGKKESMSLNRFKLSLKGN